MPGQLCDFSMAAEMDIDEPGLFTHEVIVDCGDAEPLPGQFGEHRAQLRALKHEISHQHRVTGVVAEARPRTLGQFGRDHDVTDMQREVAPRQIEAMVAAREDVLRLEDRGHAVPAGAGGRGCRSGRGR